MWFVKITPLTTKNILKMLEMEKYRKNWRNCDTFIIKKDSAKFGFP
jgi:hypothetical protein